MADPRSATQIAFYGVPVALWLTLLATVVVGVLSAVTAMIVVWRSNANSRKNLREQLTRGAKQFAEQLAHDSQQLERRLAYEADQRERERKMSLRREVYLEAAAALAHANTLIGRLTNIENDQKALGDELASDLSKIAKVHIVGSDQTVQAIMNYVNVLGPSFTELLAERVPLMIRKAAIDLQGTFVDAALAERKRFTAMMQQLNLEKVTDPNKWEPIHGQSDFAAKTYEFHAARRNELWREQMEGIFAIVRHSLALTDKLTRLLSPAILAVRSEMDLPLDPVWYAGLWSEQLANMKIVTEKLLASLKQSVGKESNDASAN
jgi:hypothetical protein